MSTDTTIITRDEWDARTPRTQTAVSDGDRTEFIVHHSAGPPSQTVRSIQDFHMDGRGWSDIGYNLLVDDDGNAYEGRGWFIQGAHAVGHNVSGIGVCYIGQDDPTPEAKAAIRALYDEACALTGRQLETLGHGDVNNTTCPGDNLDAWVHNGMPVSGLEGDDGMSLIDLSKGDGEANGRDSEVTALQVLVSDGAGQELPQYGIDGEYGDETAEALRRARASVGSLAKYGWGDSVGGWGYAQLMIAVARTQD